MGTDDGLLFSGRMDRGGEVKDANGLTPKQERFCQEYVKSGNPLVAYRASYSAEKMKDEPSRVEGQRLLANPTVALRINQLKAQVAEKTVEKVALTKEWVIDQLIENVLIAKSAEPVLDQDGNPIGEYKTNIPAANKALELLGKEISMFIDRKEVRTGPLDDAETETLLEMRRQIEAMRGNAAVH